MILFSLAFLLGDFWLQQFSQLPTDPFLFLLLMISTVFWRILRKYFQSSYVFIAFALGFVWAAWYASQLLSWTLPKHQEGQSVMIKGYIASLPMIDRAETSFEFELANHHLIRLTWRDNHVPLKVGDEWRLNVKLKRIHGTQNQGSFDMEGWALQKGLRATGYVVSSPKNKLLKHDRFYAWINQQRQIVQEKIIKNLPDTATAPWLMALIIGEHHGMPLDDWRVLQKTGTNHLMAIAGLHIGLLAGFVRYGVAWCWRRFPFLVLRLPAVQAGAFFAWITALIYSALAGFSIPTQRAMIMLTIYVVALLSNRKINPWYPWSLALLTVLILNPLDILTDSFWLSFFTIALIIYGMSGRTMARSGWWKWGRVQWVIGIGLMPLSFLLFQSSSLISFIVNAMAIPWMGFFILPLCFLSGIFLFFNSFIGKLFLLLADHSVSILWFFLRWFSQLPFSAWEQVIPNSILCGLSIVAFLLFLLPAGVPGKWLGVVWLMPLFFYQPSRPRIGEDWLTILDVGQGLSVVVQTKHHALVYDTGPRYEGRLDMGESVLLPYLRAVGIRQIDTLVMSHGDLDHVGGTEALLKAMPVERIFTSVPEKFPMLSAQYCLYGKTWRWEGVTFSFLYPTSDHLHLTNDSSCVLQVDNGNQKILLTGDIEKQAENALLTHSASQLMANILIAPHHGSKTSGLASFIEAVHPEFVVYSTGYRNRYHFPHPTVMRAYRRIKAEQLNTAETGLIQFQLRKKARNLIPQRYRITHQRYWYA